MIITWIVHGNGDRKIFVGMKIWGQSRNRENPQKWDRDGKNSCACDWAYLFYDVCCVIENDHIE